MESFPKPKQDRLRNSKIKKSLSPAPLPKFAKSKIFVTIKKGTEKN